MANFTKQELQVLASGLDALIRNEGAAIQQAGINGLRQSIGGVNLRFNVAIVALQKITDEMMAMDAPPVEVPAEEAPPAEVPAAVMDDIAPPPPDQQE